MPTEQNENGYSSRSEKYAKKPKKKRRIRKKAVLIIICVIALLAMACASLAGMAIKPPSIDDTALPGQQESGEEDVAEERAPGVYNVLVVGTDKVGYNTDTILVMSLDSKNNRANVLSIPRDTMSNVNRAVKKINAAYAIGAKNGKGNIDELKKEVSYLLGFRVDNYVVVNLGAFEEIIDTIGGVNIDVPRDMNYDDPYQDLHIHISKGPQLLDGKKAIGFVRYRSGYAEGDLGRVKAQQMFLQALAKKVATPAIVTKVPKLAEIILDNMDTDLSNGEILWFAKEAAEIDMENDLHMFVLPGEPQYVRGVSYYLPNGADILEMVNNYFNPYATPIHTLNIVNVGNIPQGGQSSATDKNQQEESTAQGQKNPEPVTENNAATESGVQQGGNHGQSESVNTAPVEPAPEPEQPAVSAPETPVETPAPAEPAGGQNGYNTIPGEVLKSDAE